MEQSPSQALRQPEGRPRATEEEGCRLRLHMRPTLSRIAESDTPLESRAHSEARRLRSPRSGASRAKACPSPATPPRRRARPSEGTLRRTYPVRSGTRRLARETTPARGTRTRELFGRVLLVRPILHWRRPLQREDAKRARALSSRFPTDPCRYRAAESRSAYSRARSSRYALQEHPVRHHRPRLHPRGPGAYRGALSLRRPPPGDGRPLAHLQPSAQPGRLGPQA